MFFGIPDFNAKNIEVFKLRRDPYRKTAQERPFHAISYRIYGDAAYELNGEILRTKNADILFVPANLKYTKDTQAELFYVIHFQCDELQGNKLMRMSPPDPEEFRKLFERLYYVQTKKEVAYEHETKELFYRLVMNIERSWANSTEDAGKDRLSKGIKIIHERYTQSDFSVEALAREVNMSETYFRRLFQKAMGVGPKEYVSGLRYELALELLESGYYSVAEVGERCGFMNAYYFSTFIKRMSGKTPSELMRFGSSSK